MEDHVVYLIHFNSPLGDLDNPRGQATHYMGCTNNLDRRIQEHRSGNGAAIMAAVADAGIEWDVARVWQGGFDVERKLKGWHKHKQLCPVCRATS